MFILDLVILLLLLLATVYFRKIIIQMNSIKLSYKELMEISSNLEELKSNSMHEISNILLGGKNLKTELESILSSSKEILSDMHFVTKSATEIMDKLEFMIVKYNNDQYTSKKGTINYDAVSEVKSFKDILEEFSVK